MQIGLGAGPVPDRDDDVALQALRARRLRGGQRALGDAVGPITQHPQAALGAIMLDGLDHVLAGLAGLDAPGPGLIAGAERAKLLRNGARRLGADGMAVEATVGLKLAQELGLR